MKLTKVPTHSAEIDMYVRFDSTSDLYILREMFCENVYQLHPADLEDTKIVVDIGANIGAFSIQAAAMAEGVTVYAYEPEPHNYKILVDNCTINEPHIAGKDSKIITIPEAVSNHAGTGRISNAHGNSQLIDPDALINDGSDVKLVTLNDVVKKCASKEGFVDVLKVDVEGSEYAILMSHPELIGRFRYITLEFMPDPRFGDLVALLGKTHGIEILGSADRGGYIYARRY